MGVSVYPKMGIPMDVGAHPYNSGIGQLQIVTNNYDAQFDKRPDDNHPFAQERFDTKKQQNEDYELNGLQNQLNRGKDI